MVCNEEEYTSSSVDNKSKEKEELTQLKKKQKVKWWNMLKSIKHKIKLLQEILALIVLTLDA